MLATTTLDVAAGAPVATEVVVVRFDLKAEPRAPATQHQISTQIPMGQMTQKRMKKNMERPTASPTFTETGRRVMF